MLRLYSLPAGLLAAALAAQAFHLGGSADYLGRLDQEISRQLDYALQVGSHFADKARVLGDEVLGDYSDHQAPWVLASALVLILVWEILDTAHLLFAALIVHGLRQRPYSAASPLGRALIGLSLINLGTLLVRQAEFFFLTGRYPMALVLGLLLFAPHSISALYRDWREPVGRWRHWLFPVASVLLVSLLVYRLVALPVGKPHLRQAGHWLRENTVLERVYFDDRRVQYYSGSAILWEQPYDWPTAKSIIDRSPEVPYDYMTLTVSRHKTERRQYALARMGREPLQRFENARGDAVLVLRLR